MTDLIIGIDDTLEDLLGTPSRLIRARFGDMIKNNCDTFQGLPVDLKLNVAARTVGHRYIEIIEEAGFGLFLDYKLGPDVLDTMWADMRALSGFKCIKRLTFRVECPVEFLAGHDGEMGACQILPGTKFLPVGPVTDLLPSYYERMGFIDRTEALGDFEHQVKFFGEHVTEVICAPSDIMRFSPNFLRDRAPVTDAVHPTGLGGNSKNNQNAFTVEKAVTAGANAIIVASPITQADSPRVAAELVLNQLQTADASKAA